MTIRFGAAYYAEYHRDDVEADLDLMAEAGLHRHPGRRVGVVDVGAGGRACSTSTGCSRSSTAPTSAASASSSAPRPTRCRRGWPGCTRRSPARRPAGQRIGWGARQEVDFTHAGLPLPRRAGHPRRSSTATRDHPAVIGFQVDNEPGLRLLHNHGVFQRFVDWLRRRYGDVETPEPRSGASSTGRTGSRPGPTCGSRTATSSRSTTWPGGASRPSWSPSSSAGRPTSSASRRRPAQFVTTCISYEQPGVDDVELSARLDVAARQRLLRDAGLARATRPTCRRATGPMGWVVRGPWARVPTSPTSCTPRRQAPFLVTETNAGSIGVLLRRTSPPYDGQWRQAAWLLVARGARMVEYWHWHTLPFGAETYWGGVLPHSGVPGRAYREIARIGAELREVGDAFADATPDYDVAVLYDSDSKFALATQGPVPGDGLGHVDPDSYRHIVAAFSRGIFDAKRQQRLVRREQLARRATLTASPSSSSPRCTRRRTTTSTASPPTPGPGATWCVGPRTGYGDIEGRARAERAPARLERRRRRLVRGDVVPGGAGPGRRGRSPARRPRLAEGLVLDGAEALATYAHPHLGRWAAVTTRPVGAGRVTVVGTVPDQELASRPRPLAGAVARRRLDDGCLGDGGQQQHRDGSPPRRAQLGLGAGRCDAGHRRHRPAHRRALRARREPAARAVGRPRSSPSHRIASRGGPDRSLALLRRVAAAG